jgi:Domain of unknown function (DUF4265)
MWAEVAAPGQFRLRNSPFYAYGVSVDDVVNAVESEDGILEVTSVARRGGHSTYRVLLKRGETIEEEHFLAFWTPLQQLGCTYESGSRWLSIDVPPSADTSKVCALLERGMAENVWTFEEAHRASPVANRWQS